MVVCVGSAIAVDNRVDRRAAEMPMPDPYLDPTWPEDELGEHYGSGDSDSIDDVPLDEDEDAAGQRALEALTGEAPAAPVPAGVPTPVGPPAPVVAPGSDPAGVDSAATPGDEEDDGARDDEEREPVEW